MVSRQWKRLVDSGADRGSITLWIVIFTVAVIALAMLLADGGSVINAKEREADIAGQAARAAANDILVQGLRTGHVEMAADACQRAGDVVSNYHLSSRMTATMTNCDAGTGRPMAAVTVSVTINPLIPGFPVTTPRPATATAQPECGINQVVACPR